MACRQLPLELMKQVWEGKCNTLTFPFSDKEPLRFLKASRYRVATHKDLMELKAAVGDPEKRKTFFEKHRIYLRTDKPISVRFSRPGMYLNMIFEIKNLELKSENGNGFYVVELGKLIGIKGDVRSIYGGEEPPERDDLV